MDAYNPALGRVSSHTTEPVRKRRPQRKKAEQKAAKQPAEAYDSYLPEISHDVNSDMLQYTQSLESRLVSAKRKLTLQTRKFQKVMQSMALFLEAQVAKASAEQLAESKVCEDIGPTKKIHHENLEDPVNVLNGQSDGKPAASKKNNNVIKINLTDSSETQPQTQQPPVKAAKAGATSKKDKEKMQEANTVTVPDSPEASKLKKAPRKKKTESSSKKKKADSTKPQTPTTQPLGDDVQEVISQQRTNHLGASIQQDLLKNMSLPYHSTNPLSGMPLQDIMKQYSQEQMQAVLQSAFMKKDEQPYNFANYINAPNASELERLYRASMQGRGSGNGNGNSQ